MATAAVGIGDDELLLVGLRIHAAHVRRVARIAAAAVEDHDERKWPGRRARGNVEQVGARGPSHGDRMLRVALLGEGGQCRREKYRSEASNIHAGSLLLCP